MNRQGELKILALKTADVGLLLIALFAAEVFNYAPASKMNTVEFSIEFFSTRIKLSNVILGVLLIVAWHIFFSSQELYRSHRIRAFREELNRIGKAVLLSSVALLCAAQIGSWITVGLWEVACFFTFSFFACGGIRFVSRLYMRNVRRRGQHLKTLLIIGGGTRGGQFAEQISRRGDLGYRLLGFVDSDLSYSRRKMTGASWLGTIKDLPDIIAYEHIDDVAIALPIKSYYAEIKSAIEILEEQGIGIHLLSDFFPHQLARCQALEFEGEPLLFFHSAPPSNRHTEIKRLFDLIVSALLLTILSPLFLIIAVVIKLDSKGSVFFIQKRMGYNKRRFRMIKFRTMAADAEVKLGQIEHLNEKTGPIFKIKNDPRITRVGRFLRKSSLDELPQLINVLTGEMSLVGPRPLSMRDAMKLEEAWQKRRFSVRPGITCLWQISGRSNLPFEQWMQLDLEYIDRWSLLLDCRILLKTIPAVISSRGAF